MSNQINSNQVFRLGVEPGNKTDEQVQSRQFVIVLALLRTKWHNSTKPITVPGMSWGNQNTFETSFQTLCLAADKTILKNSEPSKQTRSGLTQQQMAAEDSANGTSVLRSWAHLLASCRMDEWAPGSRGFSRQANKAYSQRPYRKKKRPQSHIEIMPQSWVIIKQPEAAEEVGDGG